MKDKKDKDYLKGVDIETFDKTFHLPGTIEDEIPPLPQAFVDKVKAEGGIITFRGIVCDTSVPVVGKRYMRLAKALFCTMYSDTMRHVEDAEYRIRGYGKRNKTAVDWEGMNAHFGKVLRLAFKLRHRPNREPVYANKG